MKKLPIGIHDFKEIMNQDYYYVDKTKVIEKCIKQKIFIYTRPRCFGKTLNMSMLYYFFSNKEKNNAYLFNGLDISKNKEAMQYQNQYPTIFINLSDLTGKTMDEQMKIFIHKISQIARSYSEIVDYQDTHDIWKKTFSSYLQECPSEVDLDDAIKNMTYLLKKYYHKKAIVLLDDYDTPLQIAMLNGYYDKILSFFRRVFSSAFKGNDALEKVILTGTLRFDNDAGFNNYLLNDVFDCWDEELFGYSENEVKKILSDYHLEDCFDEVKEWYGGYIIGKKEMYNTSSLLKYIQSRLQDKNAIPQAYLEYSISDELIYNDVKESSHYKLELIEGNSIHTDFYRDMVYDDLGIYMEGFMFLLGYLKIKSISGEDDIYYYYHKYELVACNQEIRQFLYLIVHKYFIEYKNKVKNDLYKALLDGNEKIINRLLNGLLYWNTLYYNYKESFYYDFLVGLLSEYYDIEANRGIEDRCFDLCLTPKAYEQDSVILIKCKQSFFDIDLVDDSESGAKQIIEKKYLEDKRIKKYTDAIGYGIAFYKKRCYVTIASL